MSRKPRNADIEHFEETDPVSNALDQLDTVRYVVEQGVIRPVRDDQEMTYDEWRAISYLVDNWTFFYEPEEDLIKAETIHYSKASSEADYVWTGSANG